MNLKNKCNNIQKKESKIRSYFKLFKKISIIQIANLRVFQTKITNLNAIKMNCKIKIINYLKKKVAPVKNSEGG